MDERSEYNSEPIEETTDMRANNPSDSADYPYPSVSDESWLYVG